MIKFKNNTNNLNECLKKSDMKRGNNCKDCLTTFNLLEDSYKKLPGSPSQICFEAIDQVKFKIFSKKKAHLQLNFNFYL